MARLIFEHTDGRQQVCEVKPGTSILEAAHDNGLERLLEGTCGQSMACATCHVIIDSDWADRLPEPSPDELDMLDMAFYIEETSRLGCQVVMTKALDGLIVRIPPGKG